MRACCHQLCEGVPQRMGSRRDLVRMGPPGSVASHSYVSHLGSRVPHVPQATPNVAVLLRWPAPVGLLHVRVTTSDHVFRHGNLVATMRTRVAGVATDPPTSALLATDEHGVLPLLDGHRQDHWCWKASRTTSGPVVVEYTVAPRAVDSTTSDGHPPVDLRCESGGITWQHGGIPCSTGPH